MKRLIVTTLTLTLVVSGWLFVDAPLDEETRRWLESPEPVRHNRSRFAQLAAYQLPEQSNGLASTCVMEAPYDRSCVEWIYDNLGLPFQPIPDDDYFELYDAILAQDRIQLTVLDSGVWDSSANTPLIAATNAVIMRDIAKHGRVLPATIARLLPQHRHHLTQSEFLIDWMTFTATTGILVNAAANAVQSARSDEVDLTEALAPLSLIEHSAERAFHGELRFAADLMIRQGRKIGRPKPNHWLNVARKAYQQRIEASEKDHASFWRTAFVPYELTLFDLAFDPISRSEYEQVHSTYIDQLRYVRLLDVRLVLVRGLAAQPLPVAPAAWRWDRRETSLCLVPEPDNLAVDDRSSFEVCGEITGRRSYD